MNNRLLDVIKYKTEGRQAYSRMQCILMLDRFLPVMSPDELRRYEDALLGKAGQDFSEEEVGRWEATLAERQEALNARVGEAISRSITPCRCPKAGQS